MLIKKYANRERKLKKLKIAGKTSVYKNAIISCKHNVKKPSS